MGPIRSQSMRSSGFVDFFQLGMLCIRSPWWVYPSLYFWKVLNEMCPYLSCSSCGLSCVGLLIPAALALEWISCTLRVTESSSGRIYKPVLSASTPGPQSLILLPCLSLVKTLHFELRSLKSMLG